MTMGDRIKMLREKNGMTQEELGEILGVQKSAIRKYEKGSVENIKRTSIKKMAELFGVSPAYLMCFDEPEALPPNSRGVSIPVLGYVRAGIPIEAVEDILDYEEISQEMASHGEHFALSIKGNSMEPKISEGDVVIVRKQSVVENGELAVVLVNGNDATVKKFYMNENGVTLISTNPAYAPFVYSKKDVEELPIQIVGKVVELRAKF